MVLKSMFMTMFLSLSIGAWNNESLTFLSGHEYELGVPDRMVLTLEVAAGGSWGSVFCFVDRIMDEDMHYLTAYGEVHPAIFLPVKRKPSWIKHVILASTLESGRGDVERYLLGPGLQFNIPGFDYAQASLEYRDDRFVPGSTVQLTLIWAKRFKIGPTHWLVDGFLDWAGTEGPKWNNLNFTPQIKLDIGQFWGKPRKLYVGTEYNHWENKFGVRGQQERNWNYLLKFHTSF